MGATADVVVIGGRAIGASAACHSKRLFLRLIEDLREILQEQSLAVSALPARTEEAMSEHRAVLDAIARGDADGVAAAVARHLGQVEIAIRQLTHQSGHPQEERSEQFPEGKR
jgi:DNA-binding FadR family transcriptional regulator